MKSLIVLFVLLSLNCAFGRDETGIPLIEDADREVLFAPGDAGSGHYRIPAIVTAMNGDLVAVIDARRNSRADLQHVRDIDIAIRRSKNNGKRWSSVDFITDYPDGEVASDPSLIVDRETEEIFLFYNYLDHDLEINKTRPSKTAVNYRYRVRSSKDHGKTWSEPIDIRDDIVPSHIGDRDFIFVTSGRGIQTKKGTLIHTLCDASRQTGYLFGSHDHGKTWELLKADSYSPANENKIVELSNGNWMINARNNGSSKARYVHISKNKGRDWEGESDENLPDPGCNAEPIMYTRKKDGFSKNRLLFVNAHSKEGRKNLVLSLSYDDGKTWEYKKCIEKGSSGYSSITICENGEIGIFFENDREMTFVRVTLEDLTDGEDKLKKTYKL
jgi:sialidase-1